jgi:F-type H+-transporting ATPase subunit delta
VIAKLAATMGTSRLVRNFIYVMIDHRRTAILAEIREAFQALVDERSGAVEASVRAARDLGAEERQSIAQRLGRMTGKKVRCKFSVDDSLIGGLVTRIGSTVYDGSVRGQLDVLRRRLTE